MHRLGLIGYPLEHSFSKKYFTQKFEREGRADWQYELYPLPHINALPALLQSEPELVGLNITIPYKTQLIPFLHELDATAAAIGAVNTIKIDRNAGQLHLKGYNTDAIGFRDSLLPLLQPGDRRALVLGSGGASRAVCYVLQALGINYIIVSRRNENGSLNYQQLNEAVIKENPLIINTTPVGMYPDTKACPPLPYEALTPMHLLYDLVYNPEETLFLKKGKAAGARIQNGLAMLYGQAEAAWQIWTGQKL